MVTLAGKDYFLRTYGSKAAEQAYDAKIAEWLASGRSPSFEIAQDQLTVAQLLNSHRKYSEAYCGTAKKSTYHDMKHASSRIKALYAATVVADFEPIRFKAIRQKMIDAKLARVYINKTMSMVLKIFKWGMAEGIVPVEVSQRLKAVECLRRGFTEAPERDAVRPVDVATVNATLPHLPRVVQNMVKLHLLIGCRPSELCSTKAGMVDRTGDVRQVRLTKHKNANRGKERVLYLRPKAQAIVAPLLLRGADEYLFSHLESERKRRREAYVKRAMPMNQGIRLGYGNFTRSGTRKRGWTLKHATRRVAIQRQFGMHASKQRLPSGHPIRYSMQ